VSTYNSLVCTLLNDIMLPMAVMSMMCVERVMYEAR
jgi:hypothetical protein